MEDNIRKIILKEDYDTSNWKYWYIITYDTNKTDIIDIENVIQKVKDDMALNNEDWEVEDIINNLYKLNGIVNIEQLDYYEITY